MSLLDELEAELKRISSWPWKHERGTMFTEDREGRTICREDNEDWSGHIDPDQTFIAQSPERIAKLVDYVKAAEEQFQDGQMPLRFSRAARLQAARKALGLGEE